METSDASYREGTEIRNFLDEKRDIFHVDFKSHPVDVSFVKKTCAITTSSIMQAMRTTIQKTPLRAAGC